MRNIACIGLLWLAQISMASDWPELEALDKTLEKKVQAQTLPNSMVTMSLNGEEQWTSIHGVLDLEHQNALPERAIYRLYSMSKPITSVAIMQLAEKGLLALSDEVSGYLPEFEDTKVYVSGDVDHMELEPQRRPMTIRDLLSHSSGLTYHFTGDTPVHQHYRKYGVKRATPVGSQPTDAPAAPDLTTLVHRLAKAPLLSQPGTTFDYSYSTTVLGRVIEVVTGERLDHYLSTHILKPLAMQDTGFFVTGARLDRFVSNYTLSPSGLTRIENRDNTDYLDLSRLLDGGGALAGTGQDYLRFASMLANLGALEGVRVLEPRSVYRMFYPEAMIEWQVRYPFGLGFALGNAESERAGQMPDGMVGWSGSGNTHFFIDPELHLAVVVMTQVIGDVNQVGVKPEAVAAVAKLRKRLLAER